MSVWMVMGRWWSLALAVGLVTHDFWLMLAVAAAGAPFVRRAARRAARTRPGT